MNNKLAIIFTTFLRDELLKITLPSLVNNLSLNSEIFIGDQKPSEDKWNWINSILPQGSIQYVQQPFDCGLSWARNDLIKRAQEQHFDYCLLMADNINIINPLSQLQPVINFLESNKQNGLCGIKLNDRFMWIRDFVLKPEYLELNAPKRGFTTFEKYEFLRCDIVPMFFVAKTELLLKNRFDDEQKMAEHEVFFNDLKNNTNYNVFFTSNYSANYILSRPPEYKVFRDRLYGEFQQKAKEKLGVKSLWKDNAKGWEKCL